MGIDWVAIINTAGEIATQAHFGQTDKVGREYISHPQRVAKNALTVPLQPGVSREAVVAAAWLHDVVEDSDFTVDDLRARGIPDSVLEAVLLVSYSKGSDRDAYYRVIANHPIARAVKLADIADNSNKSRVRALIEAGINFDHDKYPHALKILLLDPAESAWFDDQVEAGI